MKFDVGNRYFVIAFGIVILLVLGGLLSFLFIDTSDDESENGKNFDWIFPKSNLKINYNKINGNDESDMKIYYDIMRGKCFILIRQNYKVDVLLTLYL